MTRPLVAGNWKMNTTVREGVELAGSLRDMDTRAVDVAVLPPFTHLWPVHAALQGTGIALGAQDVFWEERGAFTGEIAPSMLIDACTYVLVGHSERRHLLGETDAQVGRKFATAAAAGLRVIVAVGELDRERDAGETFTVIERQLRAAFAGFDEPPAADAYVVAYEPVWAIGTGRTATPAQAQEVCAFIKTQLRTLTGAAGGRVLYGGSVTPDNAASLFAEPDVDGALVGGASLKADQFRAIVAASAATVGSAA